MTDFQSLTASPARASSKRETCSCIVVFDGRRVHIYWPVGNTLVEDIENVSSAADDIGLEDPPDAGVWIFTGHIHVSNTNREYPLEQDTEWHGTFTRIDAGRLTLFANGLDPLAVERAQNLIDWADPEPAGCPTCGASIPEWSERYCSQACELAADVGGPNDPKFAPLVD